MGRHRRVPEAARAAAPAAGAESARRARVSGPLRTGVIGASAAVAAGAVAMASGLLPGPAGLPGAGSDGDRGERVRVGAGAAEGAPAPGASSSGTSGSSPGSASAAPGAGRGSATERAARGSRDGGGPDREAGRRAAARDDAGRSRGHGRSGGNEDSGERASRSRDGAATADTGTGTTAGGSSRAPSEAERGAEAEVLALVNKERAKAGCHRVAADGPLAGLARDFSGAMDREGFFGHTAPDGAGPWDRARRLGITDLGGENIARGQADAHAVMDTWMHSPEHRANILDCDYRTLGVGTHFGPGGPWWTEDFGY